MIDLRSHILDGTLCGPGSFGESVDMCQAAVAGGIRTIVATPYWGANSIEPPLPFDECRRKLELLRAETRGLLSLKLGFALEFSPDLPELLGRYGSNLALAGRRHVLVCLPSLEVPAEAEAVWKSLARGGFSVVVAHPECNAVLRRTPARLARWVSEGVWLQVDAASVLGVYGREVQRFALGCLLKYEGRVVLASNARRGANQKASLSKAREKLVDEIGERKSKRCFSEVPAALIEDDAGPDSLRGRMGRRLMSHISSLGTLTLRDES